MELFKKVSGKKDDHEVILFAISTCPWCKKTKELLKSLNVEHKYVDVDELSGEEKEKAHEKIKKYNPQRNVPTIVIDDGEEVIIGFKEEKIREVLEDE